ncbi:MAG: LamG domain-containing protein [Bacteroidota bacterium]
MCKKSETVQVPSVSTLPASATYRYAKSGGSVTSDGGAPVTAKGVIWCTCGNNGNVSLSTKTVDGQGTGSFNSYINGLIPNTGYYFKAYATNSSGTGYGEAIYCKTAGFQLDSGLVGYWPFNGNANDPRINGGGNGTVYGAALTTDMAGNENQAYYFDGSSYISVQSIPGFNFGMGDYSISFWVLKNGTGRFQGIISKEISSPYYTGWSLFFMDNRLSFNAGMVENANGWEVNGSFDASYPADNSWHHVVVVFKPSGGEYDIFYDGSVYAFGGASAMFNPDNNGNLRFGVVYSTPDFNNLFMTGKIDNIRLYNRVLSNDEIAYLAAEKL